MNDVSFDTIARDAAGRISRRTSLGALGAAGLAVLVAWAEDRPAAARKKGKKKRRGGSSIDELADQKCAQQKDQCLDFLKAFCAGDDECEVEALRCCPLAGQCDVTGFILCLSA